MLVSSVLMAALTGTNILFNAGCGGDGIGGVLGWEPWQPATRLERTDLRAPDGSRALRLTMPKGDYFMQHDLRLVKGEEYEAGLWVRTKGLQKPYRLLMCNFGWYKDAYSPDLPLDTNGEWRKVTWRFRPMESHSSYRFALAGENPSGEFLYAGLYLTPLGEKARAGSGRYLTPKKIPSRIVPIDPLLAEVDRAKPEIEFHYNGDLDGAVTDYEFAASVDGGKTWTVAPLNAKRRGRVRFAPLQPVYRESFPLKVVIRRAGGGASVHENAYTIYPQTRLAGPQGHRLNNFVTELLKVDAQDGTVRFFNPRKGWVFIGLDRGEVGTTVSLDPIDVPLVRHRPGERYETMRYLDAGWKTLRLAGVPSGATLRVHAVRRIVHAAPWMERGKTDRFLWTVPGGYWKSDFTKRYLFPFFNTASFYGHARTGERNLIENAYYEERGIRIESTINVGPRDLVRNDAEKSRARFRDNTFYRQCRSITLDESGVDCTTRDARVNFAEALWDMADGYSELNNFYCDSTENCFKDPMSQTTELAACVNTGRGEGMLYPEAYVAGLSDPAEAHKWEQHFINWKRSVAELCPAAASRIVWYLGTFLDPGFWTDWPEPHSDMKVLYSDLLRRFATDPAYDEIGGVSAGYFHHTDDDVARWLCKAVRYYCIEGGTGDLAAEWGFKYLPGHVANPDFADGLKGWTADGDVKPLTVAGFGQRQSRKKVKPGVGDHVACFTRGDRPNRLTQRLTGLRPGHHYSVFFLAADKADVEKPYAVTNGTFLVRGLVSDGGVAVPELCGTHILDRRRNGQPNKVYLPNVMMVFKATAPEATFTITDWATDDAPGAEKGRMTYVNFINVREYYLENDEELEFLKSRR